MNSNFVKAAWRRLNLLFIATPIRMLPIVETVEPDGELFIIIGKDLFFKAYVSWARSTYLYRPPKIANPSAIRRQD